MVKIINMKTISINIQSLYAIYEDLKGRTYLNNTNIVTKIGVLNNTNVSETTKNILLDITQKIENKLAEVETAKQQILVDLGTDDGNGNYYVPKITSTETNEHGHLHTIVTNEEYINYISQIGLLKMTKFELTYEDFDKEELVSILGYEPTFLIKYL